MTTIHVAGKLNFLRLRGHSRAVRLAPAIAACAALLLAGCESNNALTGGANPEVALAPPAKPAPQAALSKVAIAPVIGAPDQIGRQLQQDITTAIGQQKVAIVPAGERSDFTLRGYVVAAKDRASTKVSYIWDVTDATGKRVNRITGEEMVAGPTPKDPWSVVTPQITQTIAQKSASSFGAWLPTAQAQVPVASAGGVQPVGVGAASGVSPVQTASAPGAATAGASVTGGQGRAPTVTSVSAPQGGGQGGGSIALVPAVTGAPGDGATSLTSALQGELRKSGVNLASQSAANTYRVEGVVKIGQSKGGKQPIQIDWNVRDPQGNKLGTVSQKNEIQEGSLDGAWGKTADAAAAAAAQGILKLLPTTR